MRRGIRGHVHNPQAVGCDAWAYIDIRRVGVDAPPIPIYGNKGHAERIIDRRIGAGLFRFSHGHLYIPLLLSDCQSLAGISTISGEFMLAGLVFASGKRCCCNRFRATEKPGQLTGIEFFSQARARTFSIFNIKLRGMG